MEFFRRLLLIEKSMLPDKPVVLFLACLLPLPVFFLSVVLEQPCTELCRQQDSILERTMPFPLVLSNTKADKGLCCGSFLVWCANVSLIHCHSLVCFDRDVGLGRGGCVGGWDTCCEVMLWRSLLMGF